MNSNNIIAAPQVTSVSELYDLWRAEGAAGSRADFFALLTSPSAARARFLQARTVSPEFVSGILVRSYSPDSK